MVRVSTLSRAAFGTVLVLVRFVNGQLEDRYIYQNDALASGWENWSWNSDINFAATDIIAGETGSSVSIKSSEWAAFSLKNNDPVNTYAGLRFDIAGSQPGLQISFSSTADETSTPSIALSDMSKEITADKFTTITVDFRALPGSGAPLPSGSWNRIGFQATASGATYHLDNIVLLGAITITPEILSAEPLGSNTVAVTTKGAVDVSTIRVLLNGRNIAISSRTTYSPPDTPNKSITYLNLAAQLAHGKLDIVAGSKTYTHILPRATGGTLRPSTRLAINPLIYGVNWPKNANYVKTLGVTVSRWGGNAVTPYNPFGHFTNAGADWFFQNRGSENSDDWINWIQAAGSDAIMTVPALDWVAKDATSYSYPKSIYPEQERFDPYNADSGNGRFPNGTTLTPPPDPKRAYTDWNTTLAKTWLQSLKNKPKFATIDNEIEIAHSTHADMHPQPVGYDDEFDRISRFAIATKEALPNVQILAPSTCSWWFYWTSAIGWTDNAAHGDVDFLPWFLQKFKDLETKRRKRYLDFLDVHYYFQPDTSKEDDAAKALRLRMTRSLWDETYVDESWIGADPQNHQPNPRVVSLIPRLKKLIKQIYPGTKLAVSEWNGSTENDITGGLVTADALGIFGKFGLDAATYWATPNELGPTGLAYWLYRGSGTFFGSTSIGVDISGFNPDILGVYASQDTRGKTSVVIVNKQPRNATALSLSGLPSGKYFYRHFGGGAGVAKWQSTGPLSNSYIVVPAYTAVFLQQQ